MLEWQNVLDDSGKLKPVDELTKLYADRGITPGKEIITYCHFGARSSFAAFVLKKVLHYPKVKVYNGSWIEWINDHSLEAAKSN